MYFKKLILILIAGFFAISGYCRSTSYTLKDVEGNDSKVMVIVHRVDGIKSAPTILLGHGSGGVKTYFDHWVKKINSWGYNVVIIDHYTLRGIGVHTGTVITSVNGPGRAKDMIDSAKWVTVQSWHNGKIGIMGFSQGGAGVLALINSDTMLSSGHLKENEKNPISAAIAVYPACAITGPPGTPSMPTQLQLAGNDDLSFIRFCNPLRDPGYEVTIHKNATHAFDIVIPPHIHSRLRFTQKYDPEIVEQSQKLTKEFLDKHIRQ